MDHFRILSGTEQTVEYLKQALKQGRWTGTIPGGGKLAAELGVNAKTIEGALQLLEQEGVLVSQGRRKKRMIVEQAKAEKAPLRVAILEFDPSSERPTYIYQIQHFLVELGYTALFAEKSQVDVRMDLDRVTRMVSKEKVDAWVVVSGSREILEWFAEQEFPTFALFGRRGGLPIASIGPDHPATLRLVVRKLVEQGHQRIVLLTSPSRNLSAPGVPERAFLEELEKNGIQTGRFNLPLWEETIDGLHALIDEMTRFTPPTAIIVSEAAIFFAVQHQLIQRGFRIPQDVSIVSCDGDRDLRWLRPSMAHVAWSSLPWVRRIGRWADNISLGKEDQRQTLSKTKFIDGGTMGPAPKLK